MIRIYLTEIQTTTRYCGGIGRHSGLKIPWGKLREGSIPSSSTKATGGLPLLALDFPSFCWQSGIVRLFRCIEAWLIGIDYHSIMQEKWMYSVYKHTAPNGKVYIGVTSRKPELRWKGGSGYVDNEYFTRAIKKYGWNNITHEILYTCNTKEEAEQKEIELILLHNSTNRQFGYNIEHGGSLSGKHSLETRRKISESLKGEKNPRFGKHFPNQKYGHSVAKYNRDRRIQSHLGQQPINKICVVQKDHDNVEIGRYESMLDASKQTGVDISNISRCVRGERKTAGGYRWDVV